MAEERNVGIARATEAASADVDPTKAELQRRMEEARESITQTVSEIKDTVVTQYQQVKETINDTLDWREQYRRHTLPFTVGAFAAGVLLGYGVGGAFKGGGGEDEEFDDDGAFDRIESGFDQGLKRSYAASPITGARPGASGSSSSAYQRTARPESNAATESAEVFGRGYSKESDEDVGPASRPSYSSGYQAPTAPPQAQGLASFGGSSQAVSEQSSTSSAQSHEADEPKGPGLLDRFKETKAYDKLQDELSSLGERFVEELSSTARNVVVPALLGKLKDLVGIDLSTQREVAQRSHLEHQTAKARTAAEDAAEPSGTSAQSGAAGGSSGVGGGM
jgi:ElaB/YqjD/DUF883 family membrane-anchored ribosome-binding protein